MERIYRKRMTIEWGQDECPPMIKTTEEYNNLAERIMWNDEAWLEDFLKLCEHFYQSNPTGGNLHIVLDEGNIEDQSIAWCSGLCCGLNNQEGADIACLMQLMTLPQRKKVIEAYPYKQPKEG
jgi:hypothetical protein